MARLILEIRDKAIIVGAHNDFKPQYVYHFKVPLFPQQSGLLSTHDLQRLGTAIHVAIRTCIEKLLVTATKSHIVIVEPPLFAMPLKKLIAQVVLGEIRALSLTFLSWAACTCVSRGISSTLIDTTYLGTRYVIPIYDQRELTHLIRSDNVDGESALDLVRDLLPVDLHHLNTIETDASAWIGAAIVCQNNTLTNQTTRSHYLKDQMVYDTLFN